MAGGGLLQRAQLHRLQQAISDWHCAAHEQAPPRPPQWLVAAFGVASIWRLVRGAQGGGGVRLQNAAFAALAAWAFYGRQEAPIALAIMAGHMMAEVVS